MSIRTRRINGFALAMAIIRELPILRDPNHRCLVGLRATRSPLPQAAVTASPPTRRESVKSIRRAPGWRDTNFHGTRMQLT